MTLGLIGHSCRFEMENICRLYLPQEKVAATSDPAVWAQEKGTAALTVLEKGADSTTLRVRVRLDDFDREQTAQVDNRHPGYRDECELQLATLLYRLFAELFGYTHQWGIITGVRPVKLLRHLVREKGEEGALREFRQRYLVSENKLALCRETLAAEDRLLALSRPESYSLYISIPFCPTRCDYCSFVSQTVQRAAKLIPDYVERLTEELAATGRLAGQLGLRLETVYVGGGTPTTLSAEQLGRVMDAVEKNFDLSALREYTVEAGRPDTVAPDKLRTLKAAGVTRVSINPQTLRDSVLETIGRRHTAAQFYDAFNLARRCGLDNINTDLIAGLPGDDYGGFCSSLDGIIGLRPESITVHTLSMKRASNLVIHRRADYRVRDDAVHMVGETAVRLPAAGYRPYYLYRQSRAVGNQENVGWAQPGREGLYNVYIMDETHTILGCGAGAVTKLKQPGTDYLERVFNFKYPYEYCGQFDEMLRRKEAVPAFYERIGGAVPAGEADMPGV